METASERDAFAARATASPALVPAIGAVLGTWSAPYLGYLPPVLAAGLIGLSLALGRRAGWGLAALGIAWLNVAMQTEGEPRLPPRRPVEAVAAVAGHPIRHEDSTYFPARVRSWQVGEEVRSADFRLQVTIPPDASPPAIGSIVRLRGYLKRSKGYANEPPSKPGPWRMRLKSHRFLRVEESPGGLTALAGSLRQRVEAAFERSDALRPGPALARALVLGDRSWLPAAWPPALQRSGLSHVLAVSGLHVGLLALTLAVLGAILPSRLRYLPAILGIVCYLLLIGPRPAVLRASIMGLLAIGALALHRPPQALNALACGAAGLALVVPRMVGNLGFQLSVAATAGILVLAPVFDRRWTALPRVLRQPLAATVAAQLATLPWTVSLTGGVHLLAPLLNLVAVPLLAVFLLLSFTWLALTCVVGGIVDSWFLPLLDAAASPVEFLARLPPSPAFYQPMALAGLPAAAIIAGVLWRPTWGARIGLVAGLLLQTGGTGARPSDTWAAAVEVIVLDVGQGDAILLRDRSRAVLIDGGGWPHGDFGGRVLLPVLAHLGIGRLDALVLTHPDRDHCGGLVDLSRYLPVVEIWSGPGWADEGCAADLLNTPASRWRVLWQNQSLSLGRWRFEVLSPPAGLRRGRNERSLVLAATSGRHRLLLTGDIGEQTERRLVREMRPALAADLLKIAHHGSKSSTSAELLRAVSPRLGLISAGPDNPHGHPHPRILDRLQAAGIRVLRTDRSGMLRLRLLAGGAISIELPGAPRAFLG